MQGGVCEVTLFAKLMNHDHKQRRTVAALLTSNLSTSRNICPSYELNRFLFITAQSLNMLNEFSVTMLLARYLSSGQRSLA
jgi:hypothetical protein